MAILEERLVFPISFNKQNLQSHDIYNCMFKVTTESEKNQKKEKMLM
jgi:hypothetical protein